MLGLFEGAPLQEGVSSLAFRGKDLHVKVERSLAQQDTPHTEWAGTPFWYRLKHVRATASIQTATRCFTLRCWAIHDRPRLQVCTTLTRSNEGRVMIPIQHYATIGVVHGARGLLVLLFVSSSVEKGLEGF